MSDINDASTEELVMELIARIEHTNGLEFCDPTTLISLYRKLEVYVYEVDHAPQ